MTVFINIIPDADARSIFIGGAPTAQTGAGGQWASAWSRTGVTAQQKADVTSKTEAWSAIKYTDALSSTLAGGDIYAGALGVSGQSAATSTIKQEIDGKEGLRFVLGEAASSVAISFSSFYSGDDGTGYAEGARVRLFDAAGVLVGESFVKAGSASGSQLVQFGSSVPFSSVELSAGALRPDGTFSYGGYLTSDGAFARDSFTDAANVKHGSDFLVSSLSFQIARPVALGDSVAMDEDAGLQQFASVLVNDKAPDGTVLTAVLGTGPTHGALTLNPNGTFGYQPDADFNGTDSFTYRAYNGKDYSALTTVQLNVAEVNDAPVAVNDTASVAENATVQIDALANDSAGPANEAGQHLTLTAAHAAHGKVSIDTHGQLLYTPDLNFFGTDQIDYTIDDDGMTRGAAAPLSANGHVEVTITSVNHAPVAVDDSAATDQHTVISGNVLNGQNGGPDSDIDADPLVVTGGTLVTTDGATVTMNQNGDFVYDPRSAPALQSLTSGKVVVDGFDYTVSDGHGGSAVAHVSVTVTGKTEVAGPQPVLAYQVAPDVPLTYYLRYTDAQGQNKSVAVGALELDMQSSSDPGLAGSSAGKASISDLQLAFGSSDDAVQLTQTLLNQHHLATISVDAYRAGADGTPVLVQQNTFGGVSVSSLHTSDGAGATSNSAAFTFGTFNQSTPISANSQLVAKTAWDFAANGSTSSGTKAVISPINATPVPTTALDYYVHLSDSSGWLATSDFSMGFDTSTGKVSSAEVSMSLGSSAALTTMLTSLLKGSHLPSVEVEAYAHGTTQLVDQYMFNGAMLTSEDSTDVNHNTLGLKFASFTHGHQNYDANGIATTSTGTGYDMVNAVPIVAPAPSATAAVGGAITLAYQVAPDVPLTYYLRYTDAQGQNKSVAVGALELDMQSSSDPGLAGSSAGKASISDLQLAFGSSDDAVQLTQTLLNQHHLATISVDAYRAGADGTSVLVQQNTFGGVSVSSLHTSDGAGATSNSAAFTFGTFNQSTPISANSQLVAKTAWDFAANGSTSSGTKAVISPINATPVPTTALDYYVHLSDSSGWLATSDFSMGFDTSTGKVSSAEVSMSLGSSAALTTMLTSLLKGSHLPSVEVEAYAHGTTQLVDQYMFNGAMLTSEDSTDVNHNTLGLKFASFTHGHQNYDANGIATTSTGTGYDMVNAVPIVAPAPSATAAVGGAITLAYQVAPDVPLTYYLRYTDAQGQNKSVAVGALELDMQSSSDPGLAGSSAGKASISDLQLAFGSSDDAVQLTQTLLNQHHLATISVDAYRAGADGTSVLVQQNTFGGVSVSSLHTSDGAGATSNSAAFTFGTFNQSTPISANSQLVAKTAWDFAANGSTSSGTKAVISPINATPVPTTALDYYVHLSDSSGWLATSDFSMGFDTSTGKVSSAEVSMSLGSSAALTTMLTSLLKGSHLPSVEVEAYAHGTTQLVDQYMFNGAMLTSEDSTDVNHNTLGLKFASFTHGHQNYDANGIATTSTGTGYDMVNAVPIVAPIPHPDLPFA